MLEIITRLILDFQQQPVDGGYPRALTIHVLTKKATVCIGVRRSGKSTYLFQIINKLLESGIPKEKILYLNFFDDRLHSLYHSNLEVITDAYYSLYPNNNNEKIYYFFDEIQMLSNWEPFVNRLMQSEHCEVYITGSSARMLSKEIATQMRGRSLSWELFPFSFQEYLQTKEISAPAGSSKYKHAATNAFEEYLQCGGFPEVLSLQARTRAKVHQEYFNAILFRDIVERHNIPHPRLLTDLAYRLIDNTSSLYTINSLYGYLKSLDHKAAKSVVSEYLGWLEDAYCLFTVRLFDASLARAQANPKKIYCIDHSFVRSISSNILINSGHLLENLVFIELRRSNEEIYYYKTKNTREVDFIYRDENKQLQLIQVCEKLRDEATKTRELTALNEAMAELNLSVGIIITMHDEQEVKVASGTVKIIPAWRWLTDGRT